jgi:hypothetical protein
MLKLTIGEEEFFNNDTQEFETVEGFELELEHSLVSLSKWESREEKPFLSKESKTPEEIRSYVECMIVSPIYPADVIVRLSEANIMEVEAYIKSPQSATTFGKMPEVKGKGETITSELIYFWMVTYNIPFETEIWHLNRLFALIRICNLKNTKPKKLTRSELAQRNHRINEERKAKYGTSG